MEFVKKIPPAWTAVAVLVVVIVLVLLFQKRRSRYTPTAGAPISLMDLQEFSVFTPEQKTMYMQMMKESSAQLTQATESKSFDAFQSTISNILRQVIQMPKPPPDVIQMPNPPPDVNPVITILSSSLMYNVNSLVPLS
jgi:hypothetical protein